MMIESQAVDPLGNPNDGENGWLGYDYYLVEPETTVSPNTPYPQTGFLDKRKLGFPA